MAIVSDAIGIAYHSHLTTVYDHYYGDKGMSNTINEGDIVIHYEWSCPSCGYYNGASDTYGVEPKKGNTLHCDECGKACEIVASQEDV